MLAELMSARLLDGSDVPLFLHGVGDRVPHLITRERVGDALVHFRFLTDYQRTRAVSGQLFGMTFGPYRVLERLGGGTVGVVFLGEHTVLKRKVAIKTLSSNDEVHPDTQHRFLTEARALARLNHPHVVAAWDAGVIESDTESLWYLVLEPVLGGDLENLVYETGVQLLPQVATWGWQAAVGLHAAHTAGLIHRDVKPSNLLLGRNQQIKVSDFGLVREYDSTRTAHKTIIGSIEFLAPEQFNDPTTVGPAADVYGLGVSLFWVLTGKLPYPEGLNPRELMDHIHEGILFRLREIDPNQPAELDVLFHRMMARNPADRPSLPVVAQAFAAFAAPTRHPEAAARLFIPDDSTDTDALRFAIQALEEQLNEITSQLAETRDAILIGMKTAVTRRPGETNGHVQRVAAYSRILARQLNSKARWTGFQSKTAESELARAATLHDLGLVGISDSIETGAVSRTPSEEHEYRTHPVIGSQMLDELAERHGQLLPYLRMLRDVVRHHHERWDGTGWPDGLKAAHIPPAARIVAVADAYDRLRNPGGDKRGMTHNDAVAAITRESGTKFDPEVIEAFSATSTVIGQVFDTIPDDPTPSTASVPPPTAPGPIVLQPD
jgi:HD-GYP domain-containing protein (c-di-GMP phosphodiesterase class II)/tRNA A-37 threonylcarbamoyl transferase component Bud32